MTKFNELHNEVIQYLTPDEVAQIEAAHTFAEHAHGSQLRYTGEPYITHPTTVALILAKMRMDATTLMAALLHDVIEDTPVTQASLSQHFGDEVAHLVDGVTKLKHIHFENHAQAQAENFRKMVMGMSSDIRIILIKLADRLHNMRTLYALPTVKRRRIALETLEIFAPIANRLGMHAICVELEDLGFTARYPMRYRILKEAVTKARGNRKEMIHMIHTQIQEALEKNNLNHTKLVGREKHLYSIYRKMHIKHLPFAEIMDVYGFRVIVNKLDDCYRVLGVLHNLYKPIIQRFKDYIAIPKINGYQSLHTTLFGPYGIPIEVQIRDEEMHKMAESGIAAHWIYKSEPNLVNAAQLRAKVWLRDILEMDQSSRNSLEFIENVKSDLFPDEVYVFTPKGRIIELPAGATPVDFAYAIHSDIGNTCVAVRLDKRLSPLSTPLVSGQQVEIITAPGTRPNVAWLNFVKTGRAKSKIKHSLKKQQREDSIELGKHFIEKALIPYHIAFSELDNALLLQITQTYHLDSLAHLFEEIGIGNRPAPLVAKHIAKALKLPHLTVSTASTTDHLKNAILIKGTEGLIISYNKCCRPIPGDDIAGLIQTGQGIEVHQQHCPIVSRFHDNPNKYVPLLWADKIKGEFPVDLSVELRNRRGSLASLTLAISEGESNIENIHAQERNPNYFNVNITISVQNRAHLAVVLRKIRKKKDVIKVIRQKPHS